MENLRANDPRRIGDYTTLAVLGHGGMGRVFLARNSRNELFAVKQVLDTLATNPNIQQRFQTEVRLTRNVSSPYVAGVTDANVSTHPMWYATHFIPGVTLQEAAKLSGGRLPYDTVIDAARDACLGLKAIHDKGIIHRDIKPSNIMIVDGSSAKVIDLGIARALSDNGLTASGVVIGTAAYMSPEQIEGKPPSRTGDVFALGGTLVFALTGRTPFGTPHSQDLPMMHAILHNEPNLSGVDERIVDIIRACLCKDPKQRISLDQLLAKFVNTGTKVVGQPVRASAVLQAALDTRTRTALAPPAPPAPAAATPRRAATRRPAVQPPAGGRAAARRSAARDKHRRQQEIRRRERRNKAVGSILGLALLVGGGAFAIDNTVGFDKFKVWLEGLDNSDNAKKQPAAYPKPAIPLATPSFKPGSLKGTATDQGSSTRVVKVESAKRNGYNVTLRLKATGYGAKSLAPFTQSCIKTNVGKAQITARIYRHKLDKGTGKTLTGTVTFNMFHSGEVKYFARCNKDGTTAKGLRGVRVGTATVKTLGRLEAKTQVMSVMASDRRPTSVMTIVPDYNNVDPKQFCLRSDNGKVFSPSKTEKVAQENRQFDQITFDGVNAGTLYWGCNGTKPIGTGVKLQ